MRIPLAIICFSFLSIVLSAHAQIKLESSNPAPRVGESITISFRIPKEEIDTSRFENAATAKLFDILKNRAGNGRIELTDWFLSETGTLQIGPVQIPINGEVYKTDELNMVVYPKLPEDITEGVWIRQLKFQREKYIILEQRSPANLNRKSHRNRATTTTTYSMSSRMDDWAKLNIDILENIGIRAVERRFASSFQSISSGNVAYAVTVYSYEIPASLGEKFSLDKKMLLNVPNKGHFEISLN